MLGFKDTCIPFGSGHEHGVASIDENHSRRDVGGRLLYLPGGAHFLQFTVG